MTLARAARRSCAWVRERAHVTPHATRGSADAEEAEMRLLAKGAVTAGQSKNPHLAAVFGLVVGQQPSHEPPGQPGQARAGSYQPGNGRGYAVSEHWEECSIHRSCCC
jgi:hypothetical protein